MTAINQTTAIVDAADLIDQADATVIAAGAGIGVDSGLPDFRGTEGFWRAYPALGRRGLSFTEVASPAAFEKDPRLAWGFYGHRLNLYRSTVPHAGFAILRGWTESKLHGGRVFTSNVDGQFQRAGFEAVHECHGSIHRLQCTRCSASPWPADEFVPGVDVDACQLVGDLPLCPSCGALARPNILMFNDHGWQDAPYQRQERELDAWLHKAERIVVVEVGAGTAIPSVRHFGQALVREKGAQLVRINAREWEVGAAVGIGLQGGALGVLQRLDAEVQPLR